MDGLFVWMEKTVISYVVSNNLFSPIQIWESKVAGIMGKNTSVTLLTVKSLILVGVNGFVHALDIKTGNEVWKNDLEGKG